MSDIYTGLKFDALTEVLQVQARQQFLLLTMSPDRVRDQLVREFAGQTNSFGQPTVGAKIVSKPE
jgi:hypothetical protein